MLYWDVSGSTVGNGDDIVLAIGFGALRTGCVEKVDFIDVKTPLLQFCFERFTPFGSLWIRAFKNFGAIVSVQIDHLLAWQSASTAKRCSADHADKSRLNTKTWSSSFAFASWMALKV